VGGVPEIITDRETGLLAEPGNTESLARCVVEVRQDAALAARLRAGGRAVVERDFSVAGQVESLCAVYERLAGGRGRAEGGDGR
jgi:glycosyltransferase involved in cell wall biosynthesis